MNQKFCIAIDGPCASGKGTIARRLANYFGFAYLDTGLLFRVAAYIGETKLPNYSIADMLRIGKETSADILRSDEISKKASDIAKLPQVREIMKNLQRAFVADPGREYGGSVLDGRDIGTVVLPNANCKLFITADLQVRAKRRYEDLKKENPEITYENIYVNLAARDEQDQSRSIAPLKFNDSYVLIDTSADSIDDSFIKAVNAVKRIQS